MTGNMIRLSEFLEEYMRKVLLIMMTLMICTFLLACTNQPDTDPIIDDPNPAVIGEIPVFYGLADGVYHVGQYFDPLQDITAIDEEDGDITQGVYVLGIEDLPLENNQFTQTGEYTLTYIIIDSDNNWLTKVINIVILDQVVIDNCNYDREGYVMTWCDDFSGIGQNLNTQGIDLDMWGFQLGTGAEYGLSNWGNNEQQFYRSENANVRDGQLIIEAKLENFGGKPYTSSRLFTQNTFSQTYGRFEALIRLPSGEGLWPAFWLMPKDSTYGAWANSGEIDIMEAKGRLPWEVSSALHYGGQWPNNRSTAKHYTFENGQSINDDHLYAVEWDETEIRFYVNDVMYHRVTQWFNTGYDYPAPFNQPFYIILNLAVGGGFDGNRVPPASIFEQPVEMVVSYVRVYQRISN
jgi:beta-glucanase (GH16 family)